jgi:hypothetical protein
MNTIIAGVATFTVALAFMLAYFGSGPALKV